MRRARISCRRVPSTALAVLSAASLFLSACSGETPAAAPDESPAATPSPEPEPVPSPPDPVTTPTPTPEPTPTPPPISDEPPPELELIGEDYERIVKSYTAYENWLFRHPDPDLFDQLVHPDCDCYIQKDLLAHYQDEGLRWTSDGKGIVVHDVEVVDDQARNLVHLSVVLERLEPGELVDTEGTVHERVEPREPWVEELVFVREDPESPWKLRDFVDRGPLEENDDA